MASRESLAPFPIDPQRIYRVLFPGRIPSELDRRFSKAWEILAADYSAEQHAEFRDALESVGDLEALELVCRRRKVVPVLVSQVGLMLMLAETMPGHASFYVRLKNNRVRGFASMALGIPRTAWKLLKGLILLRKLHGRRIHHRR